MSDCSEVIVDSAASLAPFATPAALGYAAYIAITYARDIGIEAEEKPWLDEDFSNGAAIKNVYIKALKSNMTEAYAIGATNLVKTYSDLAIDEAEYLFNKICITAGKALDAANNPNYEANPDYSKHCIINTVLRKHPATIINIFYNADLIMSKSF
jgi:hypothetical protein